jgi:thiosulfate/3-mercaptopyruvate sulfurtransferase
LRGLSTGLFTQLYVRLIRSRLDGPTETEPSAPPRFAQLLGFVFLGIATVLFTAGATTAGWIVTVLATLAATTRRICVGCIIYDRATT